MATTAPLLLALFVGELPSLAQETVPIRFHSGSYGTTINGTLTGRQYVDYVLQARGGQEMSVEMKMDGNGNGSPYFNILPAGKDYGGLFIGHMEGTRSATVRLPETRAWAIRVYLLGNDRDADKTVGYSIAVNIR